MKQLLKALFTSLALVLSPLAFGQASLLIGNATVSGTMTFQSGANATYASGSTITFGIAGTTNSLLYLTNSGGNVGALGLGAGLSVSGGNLVAASSSSHNPTATIGLSAVNGSASTFMTSDSAPVLSQAIVPTWTGLHTFNPTSAITSGSDYGVEILPILNQRNATNFSALYIDEYITQAGTGKQYFIEAATGGISPTDYFDVDVTGSVTTGIWKGTAIGSAYGGTGQSSWAEGAILTASAANTWGVLNPGTAYYVVTSNGSGAVPSYYPISNILDALAGSTRGSLLERGASGWSVIAPGTTGYVLLAQGTGADPVWTNIGGLGSANPTATIGLSAVNGTAATFMTSDSAPPLSQAIVPTWTGLHSFAVTDTSSSGNAHYGQVIEATVNQTSTAGFTDLYINRTQTAAGSGTQNLIGAAVGGNLVMSLTPAGNMTVGSGTTGNSNNTIGIFGSNANGYGPALNLYTDDNYTGSVTTQNAIAGTTYNMTVYAVNGITFYTNNSSGGLALTLDTSQNATFAGEHIGAVHEKGTSSTPSYTLGVALGAGSTGSVTGNDMSGYVSISPSTHFDSGDVITVTFATAYGTAPSGVTLTPSGTGGFWGSGSGWYPYISSIGTSNFVIGNASASTAIANYKLYYRVN